MSHLILTNVYCLKKLKFSTQVDIILMCCLSNRSGSGCVHMRICMKNGMFILGQCSSPFGSIIHMIEHYNKVEVPIKGAQHVKLTIPITRSIN